LSNIIDTTTAKVPEYLLEYQIFERAGVRIGVIGLVEKFGPSMNCITVSDLSSREWIGTVSSWPPNFEYRDMCEVGKTLSKRLRDPTGDGKCDFIIALTHSRLVSLFFVES
jgi:2',3'-cyclic-nucleotide 2'-phosphodiesterase (5'-nucleotidase family)